MTSESAAEPYVGLRPYGIDDADRFFGRSTESWELTSFLLSTRLVVVYGPAGVGKTSLLQAGVLAHVDADDAQVLPIARLARATALPAVSAPGYNPFSFSLLTAWAPEASPMSLRGSTLAGFLAAVPVRADRYGTALPLIAVVDQFEEIFSDSAHAAASVDDFLSELAEAMREVPRLHLVLSLRQDMLAEILPHEPRLSADSRRRFWVQPLAPEAALEAVTSPLVVTRRSFGEGVAETLVERLRTTTITNEVREQRTVVANAIEPMKLQVVCSELWRRLPDDVTTITAAWLEVYGDVDATLTAFCAHAVSAVAEGESFSEQLIWEWLETNFITDLGTRGQAYEGMAWTAGMPNAIARALEQRRVLQSETRSGTVWFQLVHDGLIQPIRHGRRLAAQIGDEPRPSARPDLYLRLAEAAHRAGMLPLAEQYAQDAVRTSEQDPKRLAEASIFLGKLAADQGRAQGGERGVALYATAEAHYQRAAQIFEAVQNRPAVGGVLAILGRMMLEQGRYTDAVDTLQSALERRRGDVAVHLDLARALVSADQPDAALAEFTTALGLASEPADQAEALLGRGTIGAEHGDPTTALLDLEKVVQLRPELAEHPGLAAARERAAVRLEHR